MSAEELKRRQEVAQKIEAEKKAEEERLMKMMEDEYKSKLEQMERLEKKVKICCVTLRVNFWYYIYEK